MTDMIEKLNTLTFDQKVIRLRNHLETDERVVKDLLQNFERQRAYMDHAVRVSEFMEKDDRYHQVSGNGALK